MQEETEVIVNLEDFQEKSWPEEETIAYIKAHPSGHYWIVDWAEFNPNHSIYPGTPMNIDIINKLKEVDRSKSETDKRYKTHIIEVLEGRAISSLFIESGSNKNLTAYERIEQSLPKKNTIEGTIENNLKQETLFENMIDVLPESKKASGIDERGESMYPGATNNNDQNEETKNLEVNPVDRAKDLIESDEIKQWSKNPSVFFVSGLRKVALELTTEGTFVESKKYPAITEEAKKKVDDLLSGEVVLNKKTPSENEDRSIQDIIKQKDDKALLSHLKNGISLYLEADTFKKFLNFMSKFPKYSEKNIRLLLAQNPDTTRVEGRKQWQKIGREIIRQPQTLYVLIPGSKIVKDKNGEPVRDENRKIVKEKFSFLSPVFDVSQTNGDPIPKPIHDLKGDFKTPEQFVKVYKAIENISPVPVKIEPIEGSALGYYHKLNKEIVVKNGLGEMTTLKTMIHEVTHARLHADSTCVFGDTKYSQQEFEAESVAYIVSNHLGIDTSDYSFGYLASWTKQGQTVDSFTESLDRITKEAQQLIESLDKTLSLSFAMAEPANKFEERVAKAQGRDIQSTKSETKSTTKEIEPAVPKEERPRLNP